MSEVPQTSEPHPIFSLDRCKALTDGVIAIVITLLVLGVNIPTDHHFSEQGLLSFLRRMGFDLVVYGVSFWLGGTYWVQQCAILHYVRVGSRVFIWLNLLFLFCLTLLPIVTKLKSLYRGEPLVILLFGGMQVLAGLSLLALWMHVVSHPHLLARPVSAAVQRSMFVRMMVSPILISVLATLISFVSIHAGTLLFLSAPIYYFSHRLVDSQWEQS